MRLIERVMTKQDIRQGGNEMKKLVALFLCFALIFSFAPPAIAEPISLESNNTSTEKTEILSKRSVYSKTYLLPDGSYQYVSRAEPMHYKDSTGALVEIDNQITDAVKRDGYKFTNASNEWNAYFSEKLSNENAVMLTSGEYNIAFTLLGQTGTGVVSKATDLSRDSAKDTLSTYHQSLSADNRAVIYKSVAENVDIAYTVGTGALKEDIVLKTKNAPSVFKFRLTTNGLVMGKSGNTVALFTASGEEVFTFVPLFMEDANGKRSDKVTLTYTSVKNGYELTVSADKDFLNAADTVYPVVIDPTVTITGATVTYDTFVDQQFPTTNFYLYENMWTGGALGDNAMRTYIKFDLPTDISYNQIISASIRLRKKEYENPTVRAYMLTESWSSGTVTWNSVPAYDDTVYTQVAVNTDGDWYSLNVSTLMQCWLYGSYANNGVMIKEPVETDTWHRTKFYTSDAPSPNKPELIINYNPYYGSRPYQSTERENINCMGYALEYPDFIDCEDLGIATINWPWIIYDEELLGGDIDELESDIKAAAEAWMTNHLGASNWACIDAYDSDINQNWYRVVLRVGFVDYDGDGVLDSDEPLDYHWWYQTNTGAWADKLGEEQSVRRTGTKDVNPATLEWVGETVIYYGVPYTLTYNSTGVFYQIRDIRDVDWS